MSPPPAYKSGSTNPYVKQENSIKQEFTENSIKKEFAPDHRDVLQDMMPRGPCAPARVGGRSRGILQAASLSTDNPEPNFQFDSDDVEMKLELPDPEIKLEMPDPEMPELECPGRESANMRIG